MRRQLQLLNRNLLQLAEEAVIVDGIFGDLLSLGRSNSTFGTGAGEPAVVTVTGRVAEKALIDP